MCARRGIKCHMLYTHCKVSFRGLVPNLFHSNLVVVVVVSLNLAHVSLFSLLFLDKAIQCLQQIFNVLKHGGERANRAPSAARYSIACKSSPYLSVSIACVP